MPAAIDALMDVMAPPVRAPRDTSAPPEGPSFEDHLDAPENAPPPERPQRADASEPREEPAADATNEDVDDTDAAPIIAQPAQNCAPPANPITLQIVEMIDAAPAEEATPVEAEAAPPQAAPVAPPTTSAKPHTAKSRHADSAPAPAADASAASDTIESAPAAYATKPDEAAKAGDAPEAQTAAQQQTQPQTPPPPQQQIAQAPVAQPNAKPAEAKANEGAEPIGDVSSAPTKDAPRMKAPAQDEQEQAVAGEEERAPRQADGPRTANQKPAAASNNAPTAAPRETFTALLAQQESAGPPPAAHALSGVAPTSAQAATALTLTHAATAAAPAVQVGREIIRKFDGENTRFEVRLDPPELGRVEVKLEVSRDHRVTAIVAADSPQTLADLTKHARDIEQALQSAGLELADDGLSFDLSQHRENFADARDEQGGRRSASSQAQPDSTPIPSRALTLDAWRGARVDLVA